MPKIQCRVYLLFETPFFYDSGERGVRRQRFLFKHVDPNGESPSPAPWRLLHPWGLIPPPPYTEYSKLYSLKKTGVNWVDIFLTVEEGTDLHLHPRLNLLKDSSGCETLTHGGTTQSHSVSPLSRVKGCITTLMRIIVGWRILYRVDEPIEVTTLRVVQCRSRKKPLKTTYNLTLNGGKLKTGNL